MLSPEGLPRPANGTSFAGQNVRPFRSLEFFHTDDNGATTAHKCVLATGDITKLCASQERSEMLMISALPGSYVPTKGSMVRALEMNLGVVVRELAENKAEDLLENYHCWLSEPLPKRLAYDRLMCFEAEASTGVELIRKMWRGVIAVAQTVKTMIMPVLASNKGLCAPAKVLEEVVRGYFKWVEYGLKMETLTIVMFAMDDSVVDAFEKLGPVMNNVSLGGGGGGTGQRTRRFSWTPGQALPVDLADSLGSEQIIDTGYDLDRAASEKQSSQVKSSVSLAAAPVPPVAPIALKLARDVSSATTSNDDSSSTAGPDMPQLRHLRSASFSSIPSAAALDSTSDSNVKKTVVLSYHSANEEIVAKLLRTLKFLTSENKGWHTVTLETRDDRALRSEEELDLVLKPATKVVAVLSQAYVDSEECQDHFQRAMIAGKVFPIRIEALSILPNYIASVQYQDASSGMLAEYLMAVLAVISPRSSESYLVTSAGKTAKAVHIERHNSILARTSSETLKWKLELQKRYMHDVFISYSQRFRSQAPAVKEILEHFRPNTRVFIDIDSLGAGQRWQERLFKSLDSSRVILALLTPAYFSSAFCKDEIAIAKLVHDEGRGTFIAGIAVPFEQSQMPKMFLGASNSFMKFRDKPLYQICDHVAKLLENRQISAKRTPKRIDTSEFLHKHKSEVLSSAAKLFQQTFGSTTCAATAKSIVGMEVELVIVATDADREYADLLARALTESGTSFHVSIGAKSLVSSQVVSNSDKYLTISNRTVVVPLLSRAFFSMPQCVDALHGTLDSHRKSRCMVPVLTRREEFDILWPSFVRLLPMVFLATEQPELTTLADQITMYAFQAGSLMDIESDCLVSYVE